MDELKQRQDYIIKKTPQYCKNEDINNGPQKFVEKPIDEAADYLLFGADNSPSKVQDKFHQVKDENFSKKGTVVTPWANNKADFIQEIE